MLRLESIKPKVGPSLKTANITFSTSVTINKMNEYEWLAALQPAYIVIPLVTGLTVIDSLQVTLLIGLYPLPCFENATKWMSLGWIIYKMSKLSIVKIKVKSYSIGLRVDCIESFRLILIVQSFLQLQLRASAMFGFLWIFQLALLDCVHTRSHIVL